MNNLDQYQFADKIIPHVPTLALVMAALGVLSALVTFLFYGLTLPGILIFLLALANTALFYAGVMMLYRVYVRIVGGTPSA